MSSPRADPMKLSNNLNPNSDFTRVMNEVIFDDRLEHAEFRVWCRLMALPKGSGEILMKAEDVARELGISDSGFRRYRRSLTSKGFISGGRDELIVTVPERGFKPKEKVVSPEQQLRIDLREAWMTARPELYSKQRHPLSAKQVETLRLHAEHNGEIDLCKFLKTVLKGCKADAWWSSKALNFDNVFGTGTPKQNKFTNVEKLFKLSSSKEGQAALFDVNDDQCWIDWFATKGREKSKVVRLEMERWDAFEHETENDDEDIIYVYSDENRVVHWTYKESHVGLSYLP